ncbi:MAG: SAF domain-containing protein [Eubacteriales bacterium]|nr:MAG: hypothetical protein CVV03_07285 [Firmicutes bacterium HGW-Firmicutes-8]
MKRYLHVVISAALIIGAAGMIFFWELYLEDRLNTINVVVAAKSLEKNQQIKEGDVKVCRIRSEQAVDNPIRSVSEVMGKETSQYIAKGNQFVEEMVDRYGLEPNSDQLIYSIPKEWIYSSPGSLRRKDRVYIYAIPDEKRSTDGFSRQGNPQLMSFKSEGGGEGGTSEPILEYIVVAFAKDSANQEVKPAMNSDKRLDATGSISDLELVMTRKQYSLLQQKYLTGFRFNFAYK